MIEMDFTRCKALNNIPSKKLIEKQSEFISNCGECKNKSITDGICRKCSSAIIVFNRYYESNIPLEYWSLKMEKDFKGDPRLLEKYNSLIADIKKTFINGISICFAGNYGLGKTLASTSLLKNAVIKGYSTLYINFQDLLSVLTQGSNEDKFLARKELTMVDFLVIDELDSRYIGSDNMADLYARQLEYIVRTRRQNKLPTILCTNSPNLTEVFNGSLKQSLESILSGYMEIFIVLGKDFRKGLI